MTLSKREQILATALKLFNEQGFEKTPTSAISKQAGVATGTLFHHFKSKEELISELYLQIKMELMEELTPKLQKSTDLKQTFDTLYLSMVQWVLGHEEKFRFIGQFSGSAHIMDQTRERVDQAFSETQALFQRGIEQGVFEPMPLEILKSLMTSHLFTSCEYFLANPNDWLDVKIKQQVLDSCWNMLKKS